MFPILNIGPLAIQSSGLIIIIGIWFSMDIIEKYSYLFITPDRNFSKNLYWSLISIIVFARLAYIIQFPNDFFKSPLSIISLNTALFDFASGILMATILFVVLNYRNNINFSASLAAITPGLSLFLIFYSLSLLATGNYFGLPTSMPWGIELWGVVRHPLQIYLMAGASITFIFVIRQLKLNKINNIFINFSICLSSLVIFLDYYRGDGLFQIANVHLFQFVAFLILIISLFKLHFQSKEFVVRKDDNNFHN
jgi:prolipoprotein diacylglyceryltransferase